MLAIFVTAFILNLVSAENYQQQTALYKSLIENKNRHVRPVMNQSHPVVVTVAMRLLAILALNEETQTLQSAISVVMTWRDETMVWNMTEHGGVASLYMSPLDIWVPDIGIHNAVDSNLVLPRSEHMKAIVQFNGVVTWISSGNYKTSCKINIDKYPLDEQNCKIEIGKMIRYDFHEYLQSMSPEIDTTQLEANGEWDMTSSSIGQSLLDTDFTIIIAKITLKRRALFYVFNIIIPVITLAVLNVLSFLIPAGSGERLGYCVSVFLTFAVLLNVVSDSMPKISEQVSYMQLYVIIQMLSSALVTALSVLRVHVSDSKLEGKIHQSKIGSFFLSVARALRCRERRVNDGKEGVEETDQDENKDGKAVADSHPETMDHLTLLDTLLFWLFVAIFLISTVVCGVKLM